MSERRKHLPVLGAIVDRPRGVFWALAWPPLRARYCERDDHPVYALEYQREKKGQPGELETVRGWACAVCLPKEGGEG